MARKTNGSSDYGVITIDFSSFSKLSFSFWLWWDAFSAIDDTALCYDIGATANAFQLDMGWNTTKIAFATYNTTSNQRWVDGVARPSPAAWHHYTWISDRSGPTNVVYIDGTVQSLTTLVHNAGTYGNYSNSTLVVMAQQSAPSTFIRFGAGRIADLAIWGGVTLTAGEANSLAQGARPSMVHPDGITYYGPFYGADSPEPDYSGNRKSMTLTGTSTANHPRLMPGLIRPNQEWQSDITTSYKSRLALLGAG